MARNLWLSGNEELYVYSKEPDGSLNTDALSDAYISEAALIKDVQETLDRNYGFGSREIFIYKITPKFVRSVQLERPKSE